MFSPDLGYLTTQRNFLWLFFLLGLVPELAGMGGD